MIAFDGVKPDVFFSSFYLIAGSGIVCKRMEKRRAHAINVNIRFVAEVFLGAKMHVGQHMPLIYCRECFWQKVYFICVFVFVILCVCVCVIWTLLCYGTALIVCVCVCLHRSVRFGFGLIPFSVVYADAKMYQIWKCNLFGSYSFVTPIKHWTVSRKMYMWLTMASFWGRSIGEPNHSNEICRNVDAKVRLKCALMFAQSTHSPSNIR